MMSNKVVFAFWGLILNFSLCAQVTDSEVWQPDFNQDRLLSMPDLLPLLGNFGSEWTRESAPHDDRNAVDIGVLDWTGQENEALVLRASHDLVVLKAGVNDGTDPNQRNASIRHILVESWVPGTGPMGELEAYQQLPMKSQVLLLDAGVDVNGNPMPYGTRYLLHFPDGSKGEVSTNSMGSMSVSGKALRTMAQLLHAGGEVYFMP